MENKTKVYIVYYFLDFDAGIILEGIFATKKLAENFIEKNKDQEEYIISEEEVIEE